MTGLKIQVAASAIATALAIAGIWHLPLSLITLAILAAVKAGDLHHNQPTK